MSQSISNLPTGAKVKFGNHKVNTEAAMPIIWTIVAKNHPGYPANAITLHAEKIIDLRCFDAREPNNTNSDRKNYGNNRYSVSNIDQWLNKDSAAGAWYVGQHTYDQSPNAANVNSNTPYDTRPGFLNHFSTEEKNAILSTPLRVVKPMVDSVGYDDISRKVFLPSTTEVGLGNEDGMAEGTAWGFYTSNAARIAYLTAQTFNNTLSSSKPSAIGNAWYWQLRTPNRSYADMARCVGSDGLRKMSFAHDGYYGVRPALNLPSTLLVSDTTDADGTYTIWTPPSISVRIDGVYRPYSDGAVKIGGVWRTIDEVHTKIGGVWKQS